MSENEAPAGSPEVIAVASLLEPISEDSPCGQDLREDSSPNSPYYQIKDARNGARAAERSALMEGQDGWTEARDSWLEVLRLGPEFLGRHTKDLELSAWLTEALLRRNGFVGLRDGLRLIRGLVERYALDLFPTPDEEGEYTRVAPLTGLNGEGGEGTLIAPIANVPITAETSLGSYSSWQYTQAQEVERITDPDAKQRRLDGGAVALSEFNSAVAETPPSFFLALRDDLTACQEEWTALGALMDTTWGSAAPPTSNIRNALASYRETLDFVAGDVFSAAEAAAELAADIEEDATEGGAEATAGGGERKRSAGALETRDDALKMLAKVAEFFRRTEPHSPLSYATNQVVRWGRMSLPELFAELIPDASARENLFKLTGMEPPSSDQT